MLLLVIGYIEVSGPFPHIADHVVEAIAVGRVSADRRGALISILHQVLPRELALPGIGNAFSSGLELIAPSELFAVKSSARGELPLGFGGELFAGPSRV